jgi:glycosyltransferase involved in cell wall biosynthesis
LSALAHNVPVIVSNFGGLTEIVEDGKNGFSFEAGNAESLANILKIISEDPTILNNLKENLHHPQRIEEEAFEYEKIYLDQVNKTHNPLWGGIK